MPERSSYDHEEEYATKQDHRLNLEAFKNILLKAQGFPSETKQAMLVRSS